MHVQRFMTEDLNIIQKSGLAITLLEGDLNIIQKLDDEPNDVGGLTAQDLKAEFDKAGNIIKDYINNTLVPEVLSEGIVEAQRRESETARAEAEALRSAAEADRAEAEAARVLAEIARAAALRQFMAGVTAGAYQLPAGSLPTAKAAAENGSFRLTLGIPQGLRGVQGPQGPQGVNGVALAAQGMFAFNVNEAGHLILSYTGEAAPDFSVNDAGHLILKL